MTKATLRIIWDISIVVALLYLPVWCTCVLIMGGIALFASYYEALVVALIADALYGGSGASSSLFGSYFSLHLLFIMTSAVFLVSFPLKDRMRIES